MRRYQLVNIIQKEYVFDIFYPYIFQPVILDTLKYDSLRDPSEPWNKHSNEVVRSRSAQFYPCRPVFRKHEGERTQKEE